MKKQYNKLIRDKIPDVISAGGGTSTTRELSSEEYIAALDEKLNEELAEYQCDKNIEELADLIEVIYAVTKARGYSLEELERVRKKKVDERGSFDKRLFLLEVDS